LRALLEITVMISWRRGVGGVVSRIYTCCSSWPSALRERLVWNFGTADCGLEVDVEGQDRAPEAELFHA
jgi:hypothetical protein